VGRLPSVSRQVKPIHATFNGERCGCGDTSGQVESDFALRTVGAAAARVDNAMIKALARAFRWRKMLDTGVHATLEDLARAKGANATYVSRILRLTLLAPEIVEALLDGRQHRRGCSWMICWRAFSWGGWASARSR
jgi:hypothetical protein